MAVEQRCGYPRVSAVVVIHPWVHDPTMVGIFNPNSLSWRGLRRWSKNPRTDPSDEGLEF